MTAENDRELARLRARAEDALRADRPYRELEPLLQNVLDRARPGSDDALFAHRHLAECFLQDHPWRAALHLRKVLRCIPGDDMAYALMGLAQALLGNFESAAVNYERALALSPHNPWYHHNLGHLLDVALDMPTRAQPHLRQAHEAQPIEDEVTASLAHCLARCGELDEAGMLAQEAAELSPGHAEHEALLAWIQDGAPGAGLLRVGPGPRGIVTRDEAEEELEVRATTGDAVLDALEDKLDDPDAPDGLLDGARTLWRDFQAIRPGVRVVKPELYAAALEYAVSVVHGIDGATQAAIARRYGVHPASVSNRYVQIRDAVALRPQDPRYTED